MVVDSLTRRWTTLFTTFNPLVLGSSPSGVTTRRWQHRIDWRQAHPKWSCSAIVRCELSRGRSQSFELGSLHQAGSVFVAQVCASDGVDSVSTGGSGGGSIVGGSSVGAGSCVG